MARALLDVTPVKQLAYKDGQNCPSLGCPKPTGARPTLNVGHKQKEPICYGCGEPGHLSPDCPKSKGKARAAAARVDEMEEGQHDERGSQAPHQEDHDPLDEIKGEEIPLDGNKPTGTRPGGWAEEESHYEWDENDSIVSLRANALSTPEERYWER